MRPVRAGVSKRFRNITIWSPRPESPRTTGGKPAASPRRDTSACGPRVPIPLRGYNRAALELHRNLARIFIYIKHLKPDAGLPRHHHIPSAECQDQRFLLREPGSGTRIAMERLFSEQGITLSTGMEMSTNEAIRQRLEASLGLGIASLHTYKAKVALPANRLSPGRPKSSKHRYAGRPGDSLAGQQDTRYPDLKRSRPITVAAFEPTLPGQPTWDSG